MIYLYLALEARFNSRGFTRWSRSGSGVAPKAVITSRYSRSIKFPLLQWCSIFLTGRTGVLEKARPIAMHLFPRLKLRRSTLGNAKLCFTFSVTRPPLSRFKTTRKLPQSRLAMLAVLRPDAAARRASHKLRVPPPSES
jgi:hypothetical protein